MVTPPFLDPGRPNRSQEEVTAGIIGVQKLSAGRGPGWILFLPVCRAATNKHSITCRGAPSIKDYERKVLRVSLLANVSLDRAQH